GRTGALAGLRDHVATDRELQLARLVNSDAHAGCPAVCRSGIRHAIESANIMIVGGNRTYLDRGRKARVIPCPIILNEAEVEGSVFTELSCKNPLRIRSRVGSEKSVETLLVNAVVVDVLDQLNH